MCDAAFDIILLWSVTKKLRELHVKSNHFTATRMMQVHVHQTRWSQRTKKNSGNQLPEERRQLATAVDGWYLLSTPDFVVVFFFFFMLLDTICGVSQIAALVVCGFGSGARSAHSVTAVSVQSFTGEHIF